MVSLPPVFPAATAQTKATAAAAASAVVPDLQRLKLQFPQYKTNSLLYVLRRHHFDTAAAQHTLLTSSNTRFWRDFHSCGQGLVGIGEIKPARRRPRVPPVAVPVETVEQGLASNVIDALLAEVMEEASERFFEPKLMQPASDDTVVQQADEDLGDAVGQLAGSAGLGEALETYRCATKLVGEGRHSESIPLLEQCVEVFENELPVDSAHTVQAVSRLMAAYKADSSRAAAAAGR